MKRSSSLRPMLAKVRVWRIFRFGKQVSRVQMQIGGLGAFIRTSGPARPGTVMRWHIKPGQSPTPSLNRILVRGVLSPGRQTWQAHASSIAAPVRPGSKFRELQFDLRRSNDYPLKERTQELSQHRVEIVVNGCGEQAQYPAKAKV